MSHSLSTAVSHFNSTADWLGYELKMTKHSLCIRDHGQIPRSRLEDVRSPTLYPHKKLPSASARFHDNRKQRRAGSWDNWTTAIFVALPHHPLKQWPTPKSWLFTSCSTCCFPRYSPWFTKVCLTQYHSANCLHFHKTEVVPSTWQRPYVELSTEGERGSLYHQHRNR